MRYSGSVGLFGAMAATSMYSRGVHKLMDLDMESLASINLPIAKQSTSS